MAIDAACACSLCTFSQPWSLSLSVVHRARRGQEGGRVLKVLERSVLFACARAFAAASTEARRSSQGAPRAEHLARASRDMRRSLSTVRGVISASCAARYLGRTARTAAREDRAADLVALGDMPLWLRVTVGSAAAAGVSVHTFASERRPHEPDDIDEEHRAFIKECVGVDLVCQAQAELPEAPLLEAVLCLPHKPCCGTG